MRRQTCFLWLVVLVVVSVSAAGAMVQAGTGGEGSVPAVSSMVVTGNKVSVDVISINAIPVIEGLFKQSKRSYVMSGGVDNGNPITLRLENVEFDAALDLICLAAGLSHTISDGVYILSPRTNVLTVGGREVPVIGALGGMPLGSSWPQAVSATMQGMVISANPENPFQPPFYHQGFEGDHKLVDLQVEKATIAEVADELTNACHQQVRIVVHDAVPKDLRVTAKVYQMALGQVLGLLVDRTGLDYGVEPAGTWAEPLPGGDPNRMQAPPYDRIQIVPKPQLDIVRVGGGGGGGGGVGSRTPLELVSGISGPPVSLDFREADVATALREAFKGTGKSFLLDPSVPSDVKITLSLHEVTPAQAIQAICGVAGLGYSNVSGTWVFFRLPGPSGMGGGGGGGGGGESR